MPKRNLNFVSYVRSLEFLALACLRRFKFSSYTTFFQLKKEFSAVPLFGAIQSKFSSYSQCHSATTKLHYRMFCVEYGLRR
jgi:hypothetical protein